MATTASTALSVEPREPGGSREARRLRRSGKVPGVVYGGGEDPVSFEVDSRVLRNALAHAGAVLELNLGGASSPVVLKERRAIPSPARRSTSIFCGSVSTRRSARPSSSS